MVVVLWVPEKGGLGDWMLNSGKMQRARQGGFVKQLLRAEETAAGAAAVAEDFRGNLKCFPGTASPSHIVRTAFSLPVLQ